MLQSGTPGAFGFTGELQQGSAVYLRARWYDAGRGRFTGRDPFAGWGDVPYSLHPYAYGYSDPVRWTDPTGEFGVSIDPEDINECLIGVTYAVGYANSINTVKDWAPQPREHPARSMCRHVGNIIAGLQGLVEIGVGTGGAAGGGAACILSAGSACAVTVPALTIPGTVVAAHGATVASCATANELISVLMAVIEAQGVRTSGAGGSNKSSSAQPMRKIGKYLVGPHGKMPHPRPQQESHHGIMSAWMQAHFGTRYNPELAPAILMSTTEHNKTRGVYNVWRANITRTNGSFSWSHVSEMQIRGLSEAMFDAAAIPIPVRREYWNQFGRFVNALYGG